MPEPPHSIAEDCLRWEEALRFLDSRVDFERARSAAYGVREFNLDRTRELLARLGNPHHRLPAVHIAGTKGKGSAAAMIGAVLTAAGYHIGVYTSPHLDRVEERLALDGQPCSAQDFVDLIEQVRPAVEEMDRAAAAGPAGALGLTYFEILTAMALLWFARQRADLAVLEVGLGGRLDATNVCHAQVSIITSISFDHTQQLGHTLAAIAGEKAGIIKPAVAVVSGVTGEEPREVIREVCRQRGCRLSELGVDFDFDYRAPSRLESAPSPAEIDFRHRGISPRQSPSYGQLSLALVGRHQAANAAVALAALLELEQAGWEIPEQAIRAGLAGVVWPARVEVVARRPTVVVDGAHNVASIEALVQTLDESFSVSRRLLVFAASGDKDFRGMLARLLRRFDEVILTRYTNNPRAVPAEELAAAAAELTDRPFRVCPTPAQAWDEVRRLAAPEDLVCITGSLFLAAEMRPQIRNP